MGLRLVQMNLMLYESPISSLHNCPNGSLLHYLSFLTRILSTPPTCFYASDEYKPMPTLLLGSFKEGVIDGTDDGEW